MRNRLFPLVADSSFLVNGESALTWLSGSSPAARAVLSREALLKSNKWPNHLKGLIFSLPSSLEGIKAARTPSIRTVAIIRISGLVKSLFIMYYDSRKVIHLV